MLQRIDIAAPVRDFANGGHDYELRLLNQKGETVRIYRARHASDEAAKLMLLDIRGVDYHRFEIWRDMAKVHEGPALIVC